MALAFGVSFAASVCGPSIEHGWCHELFKFYASMNPFTSAKSCADTVGCNSVCGSCNPSCYRASIDTHSQRCYARMNQNGAFNMRCRDAEGGRYVAAHSLYGDCSDCEFELASVCSPMEKASAVEGCTTSSFDTAIHLQDEHSFCRVPVSYVGPLCAVDSHYFSYGYKRSIFGVQETVLMAAPATNTTIVLSNGSTIKFRKHTHTVLKLPAGTVVKHGGGMTECPSVFAAVMSVQYNPNCSMTHTTHSSSGIDTVYLAKRGLWKFLRV